MTIAAPDVSLPSHVAPDRVRDIDIYGYRVDNGDPQKALSGFRQSGKPETFWSPYNGGHWIVTRAKTVDAIVNDAQKFSNRYIGVPKELNAERPLLPMQVDPPLHRKYRKLISEQLTPRTVRSMRDDVRALTVRLIETLRPRGSCEFMSEFSQHMPIGIFMSILDLPESDRLPLLTMTGKVARPAYPDQRMEGYADLEAYALSLIAKARATGVDSFVGQLCNARDNGVPLREDELVGMLGGFLLAGLDTVVALLGFIARFLALNHDRRDELKADRSLIPNAAEELIRRYSLTNMAREARCDVELDGVTIRKGDMVVAPLVLYNLDEEVFPDPLHVDFHRPRTPAHMSFGGFEHRCLGSILARTEVHVFLEAWLDRMPQVSIPEDAQIATRTRVGVVLENLPLVWEAS